ncbi:MAG: hypothetical protein ACYTGX_15725, partial [Planctomycetota bacterium]
TTALPAWLLQAAPEAAGGASWTFRNWLGLGCQVVVFILLVAFIFWLADLGNAGPEDEGEEATDDAPKPEADTAEAPKPEPEAAAPEEAAPETPDAPSEPAEPLSEAPEPPPEPPAEP